MDNTKQEEFTRRIGNANKTEMIVIVYDIALQYAADAQNAYNAGDMTSYCENLTRTRKCVDNLIEALNFDIDISNQLFALYNFVKKNLMNARITRTDRGFKDAVKVLKDMRDIFVELAKLDNSGVMMDSTQHVVTGMTYGKGVLNDSVVNADRSTTFSV